MEFSELKRQNVAQKIELNEFARKINEVEGRLARLNDFDKKLRIIANIESPKIEAARLWVWEALHLKVSTS